MRHWTLTITVSQSISLSQLPDQHKWDQNELRSSCCRKREMNFTQTSIWAQAEFLPLRYPQLQAARRLRRLLLSQAAHLWMKWLFSPNIRQQTVFECHLFNPPSPTKPLGRWVHCISSIQCWYIWFPSRTDQTLNNTEQPDCVTKILAMKSFHSQLIS